MSGRVLPGATSGPQTYLSSEEEEELVHFLSRSALIGHGRTRIEVIAIVERVLSSRGITKSVSSGWWASFVARHPKLVLRTPATLSLARANASDPVVLDNYFDELNRTLNENDLADKPCLIFNMDETGMPLDPKPLKVVTQRGHKNPAQVSGGSKSQITVVGCVSAGGQSLPPMVIWDRKNLPPELAVGEVPGTIYGLSSKGWIDQELFDLWFTRHFLRYAPPVRPLVLLMDGHSSHYCPSTIKFAAKEKIILFSLPPNTTHLTQPLDKSIFGPLKIFWREVCHQFIVKNPGSKVSKHNFSSLFSEAWIRALTPHNIVSGFRITGVYPPDRNAISLPTDEKQNLAQKSGVAYIPLYTPAKRRIPSLYLTFTDEELEYFEECFEDGTGNREDSRYQAWLRMNHPDVSFSVVSPPYKPAEKHSSLGNFLDSSPDRSFPVVTSSSLRVLTSSENLKKIEEKEKEKKAKLQEKEERARKREQKRLQREQERLLKAQQKVRQVKEPISQVPRPRFSESEMIKFRTRYENGYDILTDTRYNEWLATYYPTEVSGIASAHTCKPRGECQQQ